MSFILFGVDFIRSDSLYGVSLCTFHNWKEERYRSLLGAYYSKEEGLLLDFFYLRLIIS